MISKDTLFWYEVLVMHTIESLNGQLRDPDWKVRKNAVRELDYLADRPSAIPPLIEALNDDHFSVRHAAAQALGHSGDRRATVALMKTLLDENMMVRAAGAAALGQIGDVSAVAALAQALRDPDFLVRDHATRGLIALGAAAVGALCEAAHDRNAECHRHACEALGAIGDLSAVGALLRLTDHAEVNRRINAIRALGKLKALDALAVCLRALESDDLQEVIDAAQALAAIGDPLAISSLINHLDEVNIIGRVAQFGDDALPDLIACLYNAPTLAHLAGAINALERVRNADAVPYLLPFLMHPDLNIRWTTINALGWIGDARAEFDLILLLADDTLLGNGRRLNEYVAKALHNIGTPSALDALDTWYGSHLE